MLGGSSHCTLHESAEAYICMLRRPGYFLTMGHCVYFCDRLPMYHGQSVGHPEQGSLHWAGNICHSLGMSSHAYHDPVYSLVSHRSLEHDNRIHASRRRSLPRLESPHLVEKQNHRLCSIYRTSPVRPLSRPSLCHSIALDIPY